MNDILREEYIIDTPENVTFSYQVAGIGTRFIGALIDSFLLGALLIMLNVIMFVVLSWLGIQEAAGSDTGSPNWVAGLVLALYALANFTIFWGYYILTEWLWNGQSPGKRVARTRVVRVDGHPADIAEIAIRNLVRIIDFLPFGYGIGFITMIVNRQARRLGDFAAGTLVIKAQGEVDLAAVQRWPAPASPRTAGVPGHDDASIERIANVERLTPADVELVNEALQRLHNVQVDQDFVVRLAAVIAAKMSLPPPRKNLVDSRVFLESVVQAYRRWER